MVRRHAPEGGEEAAEVLEVDILEDLEKTVREGVHRQLRELHQLRPPTRLSLGERQPPR